MARYTLLAGLLGACLSPATGQRIDVGNGRQYLLHLPPGYRRQAVPLWLLAPGTGDSAEVFLDMSGLVPLADNRTIAIAVLEGAKFIFNVASHAQPEPYMPHDVEYAKKVLRDLFKRINVKRQLIRCVGFSRGARFCSRLASELSTFISAIAPVSGLRYPEPNNATRPMPIITFHGTRDPINPFMGNGNPEYWHEPVLSVVQRWADRNGCKVYKEERVSPTVTYCKHLNCTQGAEVILVQIAGGGHTWPGTTFPFDDAVYGPVSHDIDSKIDILNFFKTHQPQLTCRTAAPGEPCYDYVKWVQRYGLRALPHLYDGLNSSASFEDIQAVVRKHIYADCPPPCRPRVQRTMQATTTRSTATTTKRVPAAPEDDSKNLGFNQEVLPQLGPRKDQLVLYAPFAGAFLSFSVVAIFVVWRCRQQAAYNKDVLRRVEAEALLVRQPSASSGRSTGLTPRCSDEDYVPLTLFVL